MDISKLKTLKIAKVQNAERRGRPVRSIVPSHKHYARKEQARAVWADPAREVMLDFLPMPGIQAISPDELAARSFSGVPLLQVAQGRQKVRKHVLQPLERVKTSSETESQKKWLKLSLRISFTILLFALLCKSISWSTLLGLLGDVRHTLLLMGLTIGVCGIVISSYQWRSLLDGERIRFDLAHLVNLYLVGMAFSHFLPTGMGGDAVKAVYVGRAAGNTEGSASAVVMSRITGFFAMLLIASVVLVIWHEHFTFQVVFWFIVLSIAVVGMIGGVIAFIALLPRLLRMRLLAHFLQSSRLGQKFLATVKRVGDAITASVKRPRSLTVATLFGVIFWIIACLNYDSYAIALGINIPLYFYFVAIPLVSLVTFLPISINGFGVRESTFVYIFSTVHVSPSLALLLALVMDVQVIFFGVIGGCIYLMMGGKTKELQKKDAFAKASR